MEMEKICEKAIEHFGYENQIIKAIEEMGELTAILAKYYNENGMALAVVEEIADCIIMMQQLRLLFDPSTIDGKIKHKLIRLEQMIEADKGAI